MNGWKHFLSRVVVMVCLCLVPSAAVLGRDCNSNAIPDECDIDCGDPGGPCDVLGCGASEDCNRNYIPDECDLTGGPGLFGDGGSFPAGDYPTSVAVGDFNEDNCLDLVVANDDYSDTVSVLLGDCSGGFSPPTTYTAEGYSQSVAVGDFNEDGHQDLVVASEYDKISVFLGDGTGGFALQGSYAVGDNPKSVVIGDFNGDNRQDLAVANYYSDDVSVLLGDGSGVFDPEMRFPAGDYPTSVAVGDFNEDNCLDLVVANRDWDYPDSDAISVLLGDCSGIFGPPTTYPGERYSQSVAVGDFNEDGHQDLVVASEYDKVSVFLGDGTGGCTQPTAFPVGDYPKSVVVGHLNGDVHQDLAVANYYSDDVSVLLGDGSGGFDPEMRFPAGDSPESVAIGDFDEDGDLDLAVADRYPDEASILLQGVPPSVDMNGNGVPDECDPDCNNNDVPDDCDLTCDADCGVNFPDECGLSADCNSNAVPDECETDCNGNGVPDDCEIDVSQNPPPPEPPIYFCDGSFELPGGGTQPCDLDCNLNGTPDECETDCNGNGVPDDCDIRDCPPDDPTCADCNENGVPDECDLARTFHGFVVDEYPLDDQPTFLVAEDMDSDGDLDILVQLIRSTYPYDNYFVVLVNDGEGTFSFDAGGAAGEVTKMLADSPESVASGDLDGDDDIDVIMTSGYYYVSVLLNNGDGTFADPVLYRVGYQPVSVKAVDLDGDDDLDLAVANSGSDDVSVLLNHGDGTFAEALSFPVGESPVSMTTGDFDDNGYVDLATANSEYFASVSVLLNQSGPFSHDCNDNGVPDECDIASGTSQDCNENEVPDECDLESGASPDCNSNAVPDECDVGMSELIVNGGFETGDSTGWIETGYGCGSVVIDDGTFDPPSDPPLPPCAGTFSALMVGCQGVVSVFQEVVIPPVPSATLGWIDRIRNHEGWFSDPDQEFRVEVLDTNNNSLWELFSTNSGNPPVKDCRSRSVDVSEFSGRTVRIAFTIEIWDPAEFYVTLDDVTLVAIGGGPDDCNSNAIPDECEPDEDGDGVPDDCDDCPNTIPASPVDEKGCPPLIPGDYNRDGDVDQGDFALFEACASGPTVPYTGDCGDADFDSDNDVDQKDFGIFQRCYSGENNPADPDCAD